MNESAIKPGSLLEGVACNAFLAVGRALADCKNLIL